MKRHLGTDRTAEQRLVIRRKKAMQMLPWHARAVKYLVSGYCLRAVAPVATLLVLCPTHRDNPEQALPLDASFTEATSSGTAVLTLTGLPSQPATPALTTVFTPPSSCLASIYSPSPAGSDFVTIGNVIDFTRGYVDTCYPSGYSSLEGQFSPGICPSGYTGLGTAIGPVSTIITCCPSLVDPLSNKTFSALTES
nr:hypothetical protein CFP56_00274 [Quercus suber]